MQDVRPSPRLVLCTGERGLSALHVLQIDVLLDVFGAIAVVCLSSGQAVSGLLEPSKKQESAAGGWSIRGGGNDLQRLRRDRTQLLSSRRRSSDPA